MFTELYLYILFVLHVIAPYMIAAQLITVVALLYMGHREKKQNPERYYRKY